MAKAQLTAITSLMINRILITKTPTTYDYHVIALLNRFYFIGYWSYIDLGFHQANARLLKIILPY